MADRKKATLAPHKAGGSLSMRFRPAPQVALPVFIPPQLATLIDKASHWRQLAARDQARRLQDWPPVLNPARSGCLRAEAWIGRTTFCPIRECSRGAIGTVAFSSALASPGFGMPASFVWKALQAAVRRTIQAASQ